jgi:hypothetical protein
MREDPEWWKIHFFDFVDNFRYYKDPEAVREPFETGDERMDAILASCGEAICDELGISIPDWFREIPACSEPYFVAGLENLKAMAIVESPLRFRIRKIFVLENFLTRV